MGRKQGRERGRLFLSYRNHTSPPESMKFLELLRWWNAAPGNVSCWAVDEGASLAPSCHGRQDGEGGVGRGGLKAPVMAPSGRDHQLSQLVAERLLLNFDLACCTLIRQRDLILFIRPRCGIFSLAVYSFYNYARIKDRARPQMDQLQFHVDILTFGGVQKESVGRRK